MAERDVRGHVAHFVSMNPNKRGPVELGLAAVGGRWVAEGGRFSVYFTGDVPPWYATELTAAEIDFGAISSENWHDDILRVSADIAPHLVHLHMARNTMARTLREKGIHVIRTEHSGRPHGPLEPARRVVRWWRQRPLDIIVCASHHLARQTRTDFLVPESRLRVIYNGVDLVRFAPRPAEKNELRRRLMGVGDERCVVTVAAHLTRQKRHHLLIDAMPRVAAQAPHTLLVVAGDGPEREALQGRAADLNVSDHVLFLHDDNDVAALYAASDVGALTSVGEGLGGSAVEAQASGLPLVATPDAGLAETFIPETSGIAVGASPESVANALVRLARDAEVRRTMGRNARRYAESTFSMERHVSAMCETYDEVLARP